MNGSDLILNGEILLEGHVLTHDWCVMLGVGCFSARMVREALAAFQGDVTIRVNSGGGDPFEGEAIRVALEAHPGRVSVMVGGVAASAASLFIMGADHIEMSAGSFVMIHDPSSCSCGQAGDHRREADRLEMLSRTYASVYAARTGLDVDAVVRLMQAETWLDGEAAVASGFADAMTGAAEEQATEPARPELAAVMTIHRSALQAYAMCAQTHSLAGAMPAGVSTATAGHPQVVMTTIQEVPMESEINPAAQAPVTTPTQVIQPAPVETAMSADSAALAERRGIEAERARARAIRDMAAPFMASGRITVGQVDALIDEGTPAASAGNRLLAVMAANEPPVGGSAFRQSATIVRDETDTRLEGLVQAMMRNYDGPGEQFRGIRLRSLAMELAGSQRGYNDAERIRRGMTATTMMGGAHGVSDFAFVTSSVMNRTLIAEYDRRGPVWNVVTGAPMSATDFREIHAVRFGGDFQMKTVKENGEYEEATLADESEGLKVERRGRTIHLTFEAVVNDDMSAFQRIPREFAISARTMESSMVWSLIRSNAVLKSDNTALFHATHGNLAATAAAISVTSIGAGRAAMWKQTAFKSKDAEDFLQIQPDTLIVPPALETLALQFTAAITPSAAADVNPYRGTLTPVTVPNLGAGVPGGSDTAWYLVSSDLPPISVAYLEGYESPTVQTIEGMNPDRVTMNARHIFGAAPSEYRGAFKNAGA